MKWRSDITAKLLAFLLVAGVLPLILLGVSAFEYSKRVIIEQAELENARLLASLASYLKLYQEQIEDLAANIAGNTSIGATLHHASTQTANSFDSLETKAQMGYALNNYVRVKGLVSINVFARSGARFQVGESLDVSDVDPALVAQLLHEASQTRAPVLWRGVGDNLNTRSKHAKVVNVLRTILHFSPETGQSDVVGVLVISLNNDIMRGFLDAAPLPDGTQLLELDHHGRIALHSEDQRVGRPMLPAMLQLIGAQPPVRQLVLGGEDMLMRVSSINQRQSQLVVLSPRRTLTEKVNQLALLTTGLVALALICTLALAWYFARTVVRPIGAVSQGFRQIAFAPQAQHLPLPTGAAPDEIARLIHGYNNHLSALQTQAAAAEELRLAKTAAESANVAKSRFLATMSHEIRTPMNGILGMAQMLLAPNLTTKEREHYVNTILSSGQTLLTLLNDILDISKIEADKIHLEAVLTDPVQLLSDVQALFANQANAKQLRLEQQWHGPVGQHYLLDAHRLRQMLSNLTGNGIKFTETGSVRIEGRELRRDAEQADLEFSVTDTGLGIAPDQQALLFQPFSQADSSTTRRFGGSGLGLSIVRSLAHLMHGDVGVSSASGQGSRFWFRIRVTCSSECLAQTPPAAHRVATASPVDRPVGGRVLVAEDNLVNGMVIEALLKQLGLDVQLVTDGQQAVDVLTSGEIPDVILMDIQMPVLDGYAATEHIRQWEERHDRPRTPIIALTADAFEEDRQHCFAVGMDAFLTKPVAMEALRAALSPWVTPA
ncbi:MAG: response regulator [Rhodoferax sp.]|uniref:hybrid sensor histidine kinase/response regulator n=1 Tax=Rhodoferax sp. TaxID=50421 RepID=UPI001B53FB34|nr:ATP-binding protein [Rhodoferax sp.]MBP9905256.1 response regulator [Rhodoferax sp.]